MEIIEKVKEVEKEPTKEYASKGVAGTGLGIAGTALGLLALNRGGFGLFGNGWGNSGMPENVNINTLGGGSIKLNIPLTDKRLVFDMTDLENFKEMLITKD